MAYTATGAGGARSIPMSASYTGVVHSEQGGVSNRGSAHTSFSIPLASTGSAPIAGHTWTFGAKPTLGHGLTLIDNTYIKGRIEEIPNLRKLEVSNGSDLSGVTGVKVFVIGR